MSRKSKYPSEPCPEHQDVGFQSGCKPCRNLYQKARRQSLGAKPRIITLRTESPPCDSCKLTRTIRDLDNCLDCRKIYSIARHEKQMSIPAEKEKQLKQKRDWKRSNPDKVKASSLRYYAKTKVSILSYGKKWKAANPDKCSTYRQNRRASQHNIEPANPKDLTYLYKHQLNCYYCNINLSTLKKSSVHLEHKQPISKDGTNNKSNLTLACLSCNLSKNNKTEAEYIEYRRQQWQPGL